MAKQTFACSFSVLGRLEGRWSMALLNAVSIIEYTVYYIPFMWFDSVFKLNNQIRGPDLTF